MKSDIEVAIEWSKRFEKLLASKFGAVGKGLHEKIDSVKAHLPDDIQSKLRFIATIRNKIVHDDEYVAIEDRAEFEHVCSDVLAYLKDAKESSDPREGAVGSAYLLHHFHVEYRNKDEPCVLRPGQVIPVWDLKKWIMVDIFEVHCSNAVRWNEFLIPGPDYDPLVEKSVVGAAYISARQGLHLDPEQRALVSQYARIPLGNVGGTRIVRPDSLPVGIVPMEARRVHARPTLESESLSVLDWAVETEGMQVADHPLPELQFFVESKTGDLEGFDIRSKKARTLIAIPLPFSYCSGEELEILRGQGDGLEREMQTLMALTQGVRQMAALNGWSGKVFFGYNLPPEGKGLPGVDTASMPLEYYMKNRTNLESLYEIPFLGDNPFDVLNKEAYDRIYALFRGPKIQDYH